MHSISFFIIIKVTSKLPKDQHIYVISESSTRIPFSIDDINGEKFIESVLSFKNHFSTTTTTKKELTLTTSRRVSSISTVTKNKKNDSTTTSKDSTFDLFAIFAPTSTINVLPIFSTQNEYGNEIVSLSTPFNLFKTSSSTTTTRKYITKKKNILSSTKQKTKISYTTISILELLNNFKEKVI